MPIDGIKKKRAFVLGNHVPQLFPKKQRKLLSVSEASFVAKPLPPSAKVKEILLSHFESGRLIAIDVETHVLIPNQPQGSWWQDGRFGIENTVCDSDIAAMFLVHVGWTYCDPGCAKPITKSRIVRPQGFVISAAASDKHGISHDMAMTQGVDLEVVLADLLKDAEAICSNNGRVVSHHLGPFLVARCVRTRVA